MLQRWHHIHVDAGFSGECFEGGEQSEEVAQLEGTSCLA